MVSLVSQNGFVSLKDRFHPVFAQPAKYPGRLSRGCGAAATFLGISVARALGVGLEQERRRRSDNRVRLRPNPAQGTLVGPVARNLLAPRQSTSPDKQEALVCGPRPVTPTVTPIVAGALAERRRRLLERVRQG